MGQQSHVCTIVLTGILEPNPQGTRGRRTAAPPPNEQALTNDPDNAQLVGSLFPNGGTRFGLTPLLKKPDLGTTGETSNRENFTTVARRLISIDQ